MTSSWHTTGKYITTKIKVEITDHLWTTLVESLTYYICINGLLKLEIHPVLRFVKGHQDADCPYATLPLPAQLNVDADHLAGSYALHPTENPSIVPMIAGTAASLHLPSGTITTKHRSAIGRAAGTDTIQHYIQSKHKWTNTEFASINWTAHGRSVHCFYHKKQFIIKLIHEQLPLG